MLVAFADRIDRPLGLSGLQIGRVHILDLPGECLVDYQLFAQRSAPGDFVAVAAYTDLGPGYICTDKAFEEGGYEPTDTAVGPGSEPLLKAAIVKLLGPRSPPVEGPPAAWLSGAGKSGEWKTTTSRCRVLLGKLNVQDSLVQKHLPKVHQQVQLLLRSPDFDWKKRTAVEYLDNMLEDLIAGREPHRRYSGKEFGYPYWSDTMERIEAIWVHVPPGYDPAKKYQFFMYYKCGGGIHLKDGRVAGGYRPTIEVANRTDSFHAWSSLDIQVKGRKGRTSNWKRRPRRSAGISPSIPTASS